MNTLDKSGYADIFNYIENYLHKHDEHDHVDMEFISDIVAFLDTVRIHRSMDQTIRDLLLFKSQYDKGYNSSLNEIHLAMGALLKLYVQLVFDQNVDLSIHRALIQKHRKYARL